MIKITASIVFLLLLLVSFVFPDVTRGEEHQTDDQKKEVVYRMYQEYKDQNFPHVHSMSPGEAMALLQAQKVVFVDVRKPDEMEVSMLPGAVTQQQYVENADSYGDETVVVYCTIGQRSGLFARELADGGKVVFNLTGGILAWTLEGGKVRNAGGEVKRIHVYGDEWDYAPEGYESKTFGLLNRIF
jgi:rhodanese-related sulfurtransferase